MVDESRRDFLKKAGFAIAAIPFANLRIPVFDITVEELFQKHYKLMTEEEKREVIERLKKKYKEEYGVDVEIKTTPPKKGVVWAYALNIQKCIGCRRCVYACVRENNQSRANPKEPWRSEIHWIRVVAIEKYKLNPGGPSKKDFRTDFGNILAGVNLEETDSYYNPEYVPEKDKFYIPIQCQQCERPPCVKVCPTKATWKEPDGIVVIDYGWCIGCKYCISACPYWARHFNWSKPYLPKEEINTHMHYLGNRIRPHEVVEKCTFCIQRTREGRYPACVEICPVGARKFGNLLDPNSDVRKVLERKRVFRLKEELGTQPKFFYFID